MVRTVVVGGIAIEVIDDDRSRVGVESMFGTSTPTDREAVVHVRPADEPPSVPDRPADLVDGVVERWVDESSVVVRVADRSVGERVGDHVRVWLAAGVGADPRPYRLAAQIPLVDALADHRRHGLHAAVIALDGRGLLVAGGSGAGKSTFAFGAATAGWRILGDDIALLEPSSPIRAWSIAKQMHVPGEVLDGHTISSARLRGDARGRLAIDSLDRADGGVEITGSVLVGHSSRRSTWSTVRPTPSLLRTVAWSFGVGGLRRHPTECFGLAGALVRLPCVEFRHDAEPGRRIDGVAAFLEWWSATGRQ